MCLHHCPVFLRHFVVAFLPCRHCSTHYSLLITGVHLDEDGRPLRWKIENSYGVSGLHGGYFTCSDSWFGKYMVSAVIRRDYLRPYESRLNEPAHPFHIWDIL